LLLEIVPDESLYTIPVVTYAEALLQTAAFVSALASTVRLVIFTVPEGTFTKIWGATGSSPEMGFGTVIQGITPAHRS
jgi:hypothetical protein